MQKPGGVLTEDTSWSRSRVVARGGADAIIMAWWSGGLPPDIEVPDIEVPDIDSGVRK